MKKKGFTLIELLAVIVVLAIIALIATPTILGVIEKARKGAAEASALNYIDAVEKYMVLSELDSTKYPVKLEANKKYYIYEDYQITYNSFSLIEKVHAEENNENIGNIYLENYIDVKGDIPFDGYIITGEKQRVQSAYIAISGYEVSCEEGKCHTVQKYDKNFIRVRSVSINEGAVLGVSIGETVQLSATILPVEATNKAITWTSSDETIATVNDEGIVTGISKGTVAITAKVANKVSEPIEITVTKKNDSILGYIEKTLFTNDEVVNITANKMTYSAHVYTYNGNQVWDSNMIFGDENDVATETGNAKNMVLVKVNGDLTINEGVIVSPYSTEYGGPKGFVLYVTGTLTNNGIIDNSYGAKAEGEDVYLWENEDGSYEYIPAIGADGGAGATKTAGVGFVAGIAGDNGSGRQTGGGGSGASQGLYINSSTYPNEMTSGAGTAGTSYSGGTGGGGAACEFARCTPLGDGTINGGIGGIGTTTSGTGSASAYGAQYAGGGAGNPGGAGVNRSTVNTSYSGANGTGGLLIIYANDVINNNVISSKGSDGGAGYAGGGSSGGGSVNIFYRQDITLGTVDVSGGQAVGVSKLGGAGGTGTITTTLISE